MTTRLWRARRRLTAVAIVAALAGSAATPALAASKINFPTLQAQFMCVLCHEPLNVAQSPEAYGESATLRGLIRQGLTVAEIKQRMVAVYGEQVLGKPPTHGFSLLVYVIPPVVIVGGALIVAFTLPQWRRRTQERAAAEAAAPDTTPKISADESKRLDDELARNL
jgi:cytochrome c-type biogenesis protein CcmH